VAGIASVLLEERAMDTRDDKPEGPAPDDGKGVPPGWYADPADGWRLRWWDGARWTERTSVTPPQTVKRKWTWNLSKWTWSLSNVFQVELALALLLCWVSFLGVMSSAGCQSDSCYRQYGKIWTWQMLVQGILVVVCLVAFWQSKWISVKRAAAVLLPVGMVATLVVAQWMFTEALKM
jgi:hypothetical protein